MAAADEQDKLMVRRVWPGGNLRVASSEWSSKTSLTGEAL